jgi:metal-responsive CopG/Arc/MetJ family transcriptional regulator
VSVVRLNVTLPDDLARKLDEIVKPKEKSHFIAETLRERIEKIEHEELQKALEEGYKARREEGQFIAKDFEAIDLEGWDEY